LLEHKEERVLRDIFDGFGDCPGPTAMALTHAGTGGLAWIEGVGIFAPQPAFMMGEPGGSRISQMAQIARLASLGASDRSGTSRDDHSL
jgi:hypothetical protein